MRKAALTRGERPKERLRVRFYAVSAGRSIAGAHSFRSNGATSAFPGVAPSLRRSWARRATSDSRRRARRRASSLADHESRQRARAHTPPSPSFALRHFIPGRGQSGPDCRAPALPGRVPRPMTAEVAPRAAAGDEAWDQFASGPFSVPSWSFWASASAVRVGGVDLVVCGGTGPPRSCHRSSGQPRRERLRAASPRSSSAVLPRVAHPDPLPRAGDARPGRPATNRRLVAPKERYDRERAPRLPADDPRIPNGKRDPSASRS